MEQWKDLKGKRWESPEACSLEGQLKEIGLFGEEKSGGRSNNHLQNQKCNCKEPANRLISLSNREKQERKANESQIKAWENLSSEKVAKSRNRLSWTRVWDLHHWNGWEQIGQMFSRKKVDPALGWGTELSIVFSMVSVDAQSIPGQLTMHREELETQLPMPFSCMLPSKTWQQPL